MDKMGDKLRELNLPKLKLDSRRRIAIFGTGEVAERFLYDISEEYGEDIVEFFIDSRNISLDFHGKKIVKPDAVGQDAHKNDRNYLLASFSSTATMKRLLMELGVDRENILEPMKKCSLEYMLATIESVKSITMYPVIENVEKLKSLIEDVAFFLPQVDEEPYCVDLYTTFDYEADMDSVVRIINTNSQNMELDSYDVVLIWDGLALCDEAIRDLENAFCIDSDLLLHQNTKIFGGINNIIIDREKRDFYKNMSRRNWLDVQKRGEELQKAYVFGSGPSMSDWVYSLKEGALEDGIRIVCNEFHNSAEIMKIINPDLYVLFDLAFFGHRLSQSLDHIIEVIRYTKCKLVIPDTYVRMLHCKYDLPEDKLIGFDTSAKEIHFPSVDDLSVCKSNNVVCVFSLPIATSMCREVNIIGCDGRDENFSWGHSEEMIGEETKNGKEQDAKIGMDGERRKYNEHCAYMKRMIELGESRGNQYYTLTPSYIPVLRDRFKREVKVSVIVPVYNAEKYLDRCLSSLVNQTMKEIEIILIDDASHDTSADIMRDYESKYRGVIKCVYLSENLRQGGARNIAVKKATGEYVTYVDSDDFVDLHLCEKLYEEAVCSGSDIVFCDYYECDEAFSQKKWVSFFFKQQAGEMDERKRKYLFFQKAMVCGKLIKRSIIEKNNIVFPEKIRYEDIATTILFSLYADRISKVSEPLYYYMQHEDSTSNKTGEALYLHHMKAAEILYNNLRERGFYDLYKEEAEAFLIRYSPVILLYDREEKPSMQALCDIARQNKQFVENYKSNRYFGCDLLEPFYKKCYELLDISPALLAKQYASGEIFSENYDTYYAEHLQEINEIFEMCSEHAWKPAIWGGGQKGSSFLRIADPDCSMIQCVIDKNEKKRNTLMDTGHIIQGLEDAADKLDIILVMNKHYFESVKYEVKNTRENIRLLNLDMYFLMSKDYKLEAMVE